MEIVYFWNTPSSLSTHHFNEIKSFIQSSLATFKIGPKNVRMSLVQYPTSPSSDQPSTLKYYDDIKEIERLVKDIKMNQQQPEEDGSKAVMGLNEVFQKTLRDLNVNAGSGNDGKKSTPKVFVFFIREIEAQKALDLQQFEDNISELKRRNVRPLIVYFGRKNLDKLQGIVGNPSQVIQIGDWDGMLNGIGSLEQQIGKPKGKVFFTKHYLIKSISLF